MSNYVKPQSPIYNRKTDTYLYPLTTADQVIMPDGSRLTNTGVIQKNYSVVGGLEEPTNPTQNMIWIQTETPINRVFFGNDEPNEILTNGDVWIATGNFSSVAFNALKVDNEYMNEVYPLNAKQYVGSAWIDVTAKSYQNGEWVNWILYLAGNGVNLSETLGTFGNIVAAQWVYTNDTLTLSRKAHAQESAGYSSVEYDVTNLNELVITVTNFSTGDNTTLLGISRKDSITFLAFATITDNNKYVIDISAVEGKVVFCCQLSYEGCSITIPEIYMR